MQILLSNSQAGPGTTVKQEQEEISRMHPRASLCSGRCIVFAREVSCKRITSMAHNLLPEGSERAGRASSEEEVSGMPRGCHLRGRAGNKRLTQRDLCLIAPSRVTTATRRLRRRRQLIASPPATVRKIERHGTNTSTDAVKRILHRCQTLLQLSNVEQSVC